MHARICSVLVLSILGWPIATAAQPALRPTLRPTSQATSQAASQPASQATSQATSQPASQAASQPAPQPASRSTVARSTAAPASQPATSSEVRADGLFALGRHGEALVLYQLAQQEQPGRTALLLRIAGCHERLGGARRWREAQAAYRRYLAANPRSTARRRIERRIARLEHRIAQAGHAGDDAEPGGTPVYKKWWFWTGLIVVVGAVVVGIVLASQVDSDIPRNSQPLRAPPFFLRFF